MNTQYSHHSIVQTCGVLAAELQDSGEEFQHFDFYLRSHNSPELWGQRHQLRQQQVGITQSSW